MVCIIVSTWCRYLCPSIIDSISTLLLHTSLMSRLCLRYLGDFFSLSVWFSLIFEADCGLLFVLNFNAQFGTFAGMYSGKKEKYELKPLLHRILLFLCVGGTVLANPASSHILKSFTLTLLATPWRLSIICLLVFTFLWKSPKKNNWLFSSDIVSPPADNKESSSHLCDPDSLRSSSDKYICFYLKIFPWVYSFIFWRLQFPNLGSVRLNLIWATGTKSSKT